MKLRNKGTGRIGQMVVCGDSYMIVDSNNKNLLLAEYLSLSHLMEDWEDYWSDEVDSEKGRKEI